MSGKNLRICHLYGNLLNTYGDNGNLLMLKWRAQQQGYEILETMVSLGDDFNADNFDIVFFGGGQDYEQSVVSEDLKNKKTELTRYIEDDGVLVAICGGFQLLGHYYVAADGAKIDGIGALDHYTLNQPENRTVGEIEIFDPETGMTLYGYENHNGATYLGPDLKPLGVVRSGGGNNGTDSTEGARYKNTFCSYFHGPLLVRNIELADVIIDLAVQRQQRKNCLDHVACENAERAAE